MKRSATAGERVRDMKELEPRVFVVDDDQSVRTRSEERRVGKECVP